MINKIDSRLWEVVGLIDPEQLLDIQSLPWTEFAWQSQDMQEAWQRRRICDNPDVGRVNNYIQQRLPEINQAMGTDFKSCSGHWWLDTAGFTCSIHTDGHLPNSMQLYWLAPDEHCGTVFYYYKNQSQLRHRFTGQPNTGYIMLNHLDEGQSQPLQWHGMLHPVPPGKIRLSSYFYFYK
jgi:hypothetical protein